MALDKYEKIAASIVGRLIRKAECEVSIPTDLVTGVVDAVNRSCLIKGGLEAKIISIDEVNSTCQVKATHRLNLEKNMFVD